MVKTSDFSVKGVLIYGAPLVAVCLIAAWFHVLTAVAVCVGSVLALVVAFFTFGILLMIKKGEIASRRGPWIALLAGACLAAFSPLAYLMFQSVHRSQEREEPEYVLKMINPLRSAGEVEQNEQYFTPQGKAIYLWAIEQNGDAPMTVSKDRYAVPIIHGEICDIGFATDNGAGTVRLLKSDHWRFHDFYVDKSKGKEVGLWLSYAKDHPYATAWTLLWK